MSSGVLLCRVRVTAWPTLAGCDRLLSVNASGEQPRPSRSELVARLDLAIATEGDPRDTLSATVTTLLRDGVPKDQVMDALREIFQRGDDPVPVDEVMARLEWGEYDRG